MTLHPISLEDFALDPGLGNFPEASPAQRLVLRLLDGLPPGDAEQAAIFEAIAGRPWGEDLQVPRKVVALIMGADSGKSLIAALLLLHRALFADLAGLRPGQRGVGLLVAPDTRLAAIPLAYVRGILQTSEIVRLEVESETADSIRFKRGTEITILPATLGGRAVRGRRFIAAVAEEVAFFRDSDYRVNDVEIIRAIRPRLLPGAHLVAISTPYRKAGWLYDLHRSEFGHSHRSLVLQASTAVMRPDKSADVIAEEYAADPVSAVAELGAEFLENVSGLFESADLESVLDLGVTRREPIDGWSYVAATDPSGLRNDPWAFTIIGRKDDQYAQFLVRSWRPGVAVETIVMDIAADLKRFGLSTLLSDQFGSEVTKAHFTKTGVALEERPFTSGAASPKTLGFKALKELVLARRMRLLDDPEQTRELRLLEVSRLSGGGERIAAPGRLHDDRACALALAVGEIAKTEAEPVGLRAIREQAERMNAAEPEPIKKTAMPIFRGIPPPA